MATRQTLTEPTTKQLSSARQFSALRNIARAEALTPMEQVYYDSLHKDDTIASLIKELKKMGASDEAIAKFAYKISGNTIVESQKPKYIPMEPTSGD